MQSLHNLPTSKLIIIIPCSYILYDKNKRDIYHLIKFLIIEEGNFVYSYQAPALNWFLSFYTYVT